MMALLLRWVISAASILIVSYLGVGIRVSGISSALLAALVLGLVDLIVRPVLLFVTLPINVLTFGLFIFVVNGILLLIVGAIVKGFTVNGILGAIVASILIGMIGTVLQFVVRVL